MPFTSNYSQSVLLSVIKSTTEIGLLKGPSASAEITAGECTGYTRQEIGTLNTDIYGQIANKDIIFMFECTGGAATATHFGLFSGSTMIFYGALSTQLPISDGYVPLIRARNLVIGLDKEQLDPYD